MVVARIALGCDSIGPFARPDAAVVSPSVPVQPAAAAAAAVVVVAIVAIVVVVSVVAAAAVVLDLSIGSEVGSAKGERRVSLSERHGTVQRSVFDSVVDRHMPTSMETGKNAATDTMSVDVTDCCSVATSPAGRIGDTAVTVLTPSSLEVPDV